MHWPETDTDSHAAACNYVNSKALREACETYGRATPIEGLGLNGTFQVLGFRKGFGAHTRTIQDFVPTPGLGLKVSGFMVGGGLGC